MSAAVTLTHAGTGSSLELVPDAGMVALSWIVAGEEVLALPCGRSEFLAASRTGGIPLLYPYANRLGADRFDACGRAVDLTGVTSLKRDDHGLPIHGLLLRKGGWALEVPAAGQIAAQLDWGSDPELLAAFPFPHTLRIHWTVGAGVAPGATALRVTTSVIADRGSDVPAAFGWHPYFKVHEPERAQVLMGAAASVALGHDGLPTGDPPIGAAMPIRMGVGRGQDSLYLRQIGADASLQPVASVIDARRRIDIRMDGHFPFVQVFSPQGASFACIEPMVAATDALRRGNFTLVPSGSALVATFEVEVIPCPPASGTGLTRPPSASA
jgi:aldose 1-epimerase